MVSGPENMYLAFKSFTMFSFLLLQLGFAHMFLKMLFPLLTQRLLSDVTYTTKPYIIMPIKLCAYECIEIILNNAGHRGSVHPCIRISNKMLYLLEMWYFNTGLQKVPRTLFKRICQMISSAVIPM